MRVERTWRRFLSTCATQLANKIWPGAGGVENLPFARLEDDRLRNILRRLFREGYDKGGVFRTLHEEATSRGLDPNYASTVVLHAPVRDDGLVTRGGLFLAVTPFGIEVNVDVREADAKLIMTWEELDLRRRDVEAAHRSDKPVVPITRKLDL